MRKLLALATISTVAVAVAVAGPGAVAGVAGSASAASGSGVISESTVSYTDRTTNSVPVHGPDTVRTGVDGILLGAARELLSNVGKHAGAHHATLTLGLVEDDATLTVTDDGTGISTTRPGPADGHIGLHSQQLRIAAAGGSLDVTGSPTGTTATVVVPTNAHTRRRLTAAQAGLRRRRRRTVTCLPRRSRAVSRVSRRRPMGMGDEHGGFAGSSRDECGAPGAHRSDHAVLCG